MTATLTQFLIVCPLLFLAGFIDAVAGGGGLISLPACLIAGLPTHRALGTNKLSSFMGTTLATVRYAKQGFIPWKQAAFCAVCAILGAFGGAQLAMLLSDGVFRIIMLVVLPLTGAYVLRSRAFKDGTEPYSETKTTLLAMVISLGIGVYDGFYGPGSGTFLLLLLTGAAHMELSRANGIAKAVGLFSDLTTVSVYLFNGKVDWLLGLVAGVFSIGGSYLGTLWFTKGEAKKVKPVIILVLAVFFVKTVWELLSK